MKVTHFLCYLLKTALANAGYFKQQENMPFYYFLIMKVTHFLCYLLKTALVNAGYFK